MMSLSLPSDMQRVDLTRMIFIDRLDVLCTAGGAIRHHESH